MLVEVDKQINNSIQRGRILKRKNENIFQFRFSTQNTTVIHNMHCVYQ